MMPMNHHPVGVTWNYAIQANLFGGMRDAAEKLAAKIAAYRNKWKPDNLAPQVEVPMPETLLDRETKTRDELFQAAWESLSIQESVWKALAATANHGGDDVLRTCSCLGRYYADRGRAVLTLCVRGFDWDADIIVRTMYECAAKVFRIALAPAADREALVDEFWEWLPESSDRKIARKAALAEAVFPDGHPSRDVFALMKDARMQRTSRNLNKAQRRQLEGKWSFAEIVAELATNSVGNDINALLHIYGMASHLAHADHVAMDLMFDRSIRPAEELLTLRIGHAARIASDISSLGYFCCRLSARLAGNELEMTSGAAEANERVFRIAQKHEAAFNKSQVLFYDRMLGRS